MNLRLENGGGEGASKLEALQNEVAVEVFLLAVGGEAGNLAEGEGSGGRAAASGGRAGFADGGEEGVDFVLGCVVAKAVDALGMLPAEEKVVFVEGGEAMGGAALGGDRGGFGSQARVVQELPERHDGKAAGSQGAEEPLENPGAQGECRQMVHESEGDGEVVRVAGETVGEGAVEEGFHDVEGAEIYDGLFGGIRALP